MRKTLISTIMAVIAIVITAMCANEALANSKGKKVTIKVGSYNLMTSDSRVKHISKTTGMSEQRYWCNSAQAVSSIISDMDCDIIGLQEICDSIWGWTGDKGFRDMMAEDAKNSYNWVLYPNGSTGRNSYNVAIGYKADKFTELESGIYWLAGIFDRSEALPTAPKGSKRPCVWAKFQHNESGKIFYFFSTHFVVPGISSEGNAYNAENCIKYAEHLMGSRKMPSIIVGDFNGAKGSPSYKIVAESGRWFDVYEYLKEDGVLSSEETGWGTCNDKDEKKWSYWRPDHITCDGSFRPISFETIRKKYPTSDGTLHYPSDHFPIVAELKF